MEDKWTKEGTKVVDFPLRVVARVRANAAGLGRNSSFNAVSANAKTMVGEDCYLGSNASQVSLLSPLLLPTSDALFECPPGACVRGGG